MDFPLLGAACARDQGATLSHCPSWALRDRHSYISPLVFRALYRPSHNEVMAVVATMATESIVLDTIFAKAAGAINPPTRAAIVTASPQTLRGVLVKELNMVCAPLC